MRPALLPLTVLILACGTPENQSSEDQPNGSGTATIILTDAATGLINGWRGNPNDIDDGFAIALAIASKDINLTGIIATFGNNYAEPAASVASHVANTLMGTGIPVIMGAEVKLTDPPLDTYLGNKPTEFCENAATKFLKAQIKEHGKINIIGIGPLTDIGCLINNDPTVADKGIASIVTIMGREPNEAFQIGGVVGLSDFNYVEDERAVKIILEESSIPTTFMTFKLTASTFIKQAELDNIETKNGGLKNFLQKASKPFVAFWNKIFKEDGFHPWDQNAVYYNIDSDVYDCKLGGYQITECIGEKDNYPCAGHSATQKSALDKEASQLWLSKDYTNTRQITYCSNFVSVEDKNTFHEALLQF